MPLNILKDRNATSDFITNSIQVINPGEKSDGIVMFEFESMALPSLS